MDHQEHTEREETCRERLAPRPLSAVLTSKPLWAANESTAPSPPSRTTCGFTTQRVHAPMLLSRVLLVCRALSLTSSWKMCRACSTACEPKARRQSYVTRAVCVLASLSDFAFGVVEVGATAPSHGKASHTTLEETKHWNISLPRRRPGCYHPCV